MQAETQSQGERDAPWSNGGPKQRPKRLIRFHSG